MLLCINSIVVHAQKKTAEDLVNEFAATLDSLPNKKKQLSNLVETKHQEVD
jgi:hypothetical protein